MKYIQHYADYRKKQVERIKKIQLILIEKKKLLREELSQKEVVIKIKNREKNNYLNDKDAQETYLNDLKRSESSLTQELKINNQKEEK